jgi:hypothetical protein
VRNGPFLVDWVVFDGKFEFSEVKSDSVTLFGGRVSGFVSVVRFGDKVVFLNSVLGKNKVVGQSVNVLVNVVFDSERLDVCLVCHWIDLEVSNNFKVHVASVMSDPVFASITISIQFEGLSIVRFDKVGVEYGTETATLTANITSAALTVGLGWRDVSVILAVWTCWWENSAGNSVAPEFTFGDTFASLASVGLVSDHSNAWSVDLTVVFTTALFFNVNWAASVGGRSNEFDSVDADVGSGWGDTEDWFASANWFWATFTVCHPLELVTLRLTSDSRGFQDGWFIASSWVADTVARIAASTDFSNRRSDVSEFGTGFSEASFGTRSRGTFDGSDLGTFGFNAFALVTTFGPESTTTVSFFGQWVQTVLLVDFAGFTTSAGHDHSGVTFAASDLAALFLEALFHTVDTLAGGARFLPGVAGWYQSTVDLTWAFRRFYHGFTVTEEFLFADGASHIADGHSAFGDVADVWASWDFAITSARIASIRSVFGSVAGSENSFWGASTASAAFHVFTGDWWTFFGVTDTDEFWAETTVFVFSVESDSFFVGFAAWSFDLEASINAFVFNTFVSQTAFVTSVSQKSFVS